VTPELTETPEITVTPEPTVTPDITVTTEPGNDTGVNDPTPLIGTTDPTVLG